jgi:hypothetical protein
LSKKIKIRGLDNGKDGYPKNPSEARAGYTLARKELITNLDGPFPSKK